MSASSPVAASEFSKLSWQRALNGHRLSPAQYRVLLTLFSFTDGNGAGARPGWPLLTAATALDQRTVKRAVKDLVEAGYLVRTGAGGGRGRAASFALGDLTQARLRPDTGVLADPLSPPKQGHRMSPFAPETGASDAPESAQKGAQPVPPFSQETSTSGAPKGGHPVHVKGGTGCPPIRSRSDQGTEKASALTRRPSETDEAPRTGSRLAAGWRPSPETVAQIRSEIPGLDLEAEHRRFLDYWTDQPGARGRKVTWEGTWRNWMRKAGEDLARRSPASRRQQETDQLFDDAMERARKLENGDIFDAAARRLGVTPPAGRGELP